MFRFSLLVRLAGSWALLVLLLTSAAAARPGAQETLLLFLDPVHQAVTLQLPSSAPHKGLQLSMLDGAGRIIYRKPFSTASGPLVSFPVGGYAAGTYLLIVEGPEGYSIAQRLVLK